MNHPAMDIAGVAHPEVIRQVSHLGPDVEEIGALLLAACERVGGETKRLTRCPTSPHRMGEQGRSQRVYRLGSGRSRPSA